jgi:hypothetical protein
MMASALALAFAVAGPAFAASSDSSGGGGNVSTVPDTANTAGGKAPVNSSQGYAYNPSTTTAGQTAGTPGKTPAVGTATSEAPPTNGTAGGGGGGASK